MLKGKKFDASALLHVFIIIVGFLEIYIFVFRWGRFFCYVFFFVVAIDSCWGCFFVGVVFCCDVFLRCDCFSLFCDCLLSKLFYRDVFLVYL